ENIYPITYGLNSKSTVTASSIDDTDKLQFSYCLQRGIYTISNEIIKPFEKPFIESGSSDEILYYLAALTCILIIDYKF
ncbi:MAG TPA: UDP-N-acetylmuramyl peptide synthase, partial [Clostridiaceae bacterium]|nr:UDP-N-acetylmuramyl peptide synthase [Clostridiaceae bacterium]